MPSEPTTTTDPLRCIDGDGIKATCGAARTLPRTYAGTFSSIVIDNARHITQLADAIRAICARLDDLATAEQTLQRIADWLAQADTDRDSIKTACDQNPCADGWQHCRKEQNETIIRGHEPTTARTARSRQICH